MYRNSDQVQEDRFRPFFHGPPLRGVIPIAVLSLIKDKPVHGGEIFQNLQDKYNVDVARPVVYMLLRRMERYGLILSTWDIPENGPARRRYTITEEGLDHLKYGLERLKKLSKTISLLTGEKA
jgi:PadR family transcriptional regulator PadR